MKLSKKAADLANKSIENRRLRKLTKKLEKAMDALSVAPERTNFRLELEVLVSLLLPLRKP